MIFPSAVNSLKGLREQQSLSLKNCTKFGAVWHLIAPHVSGVWERQSLVPLCRYWSEFEKKPPMFSWDKGKLYKS